MRLFILGATGGIGGQLVEQALARGYRVTAFVRSPERLGRAHERLTILGGDPLDAEQLRRALPDHDGVLSAIGPRGRAEHSVHRDLARSLVPAMVNAAVRRLVVVSSAFLFSDSPIPALVGRLFFHDVVKAAAEIERMIFASSLEWTIVRPPWLTDGSRTEHYRIKDNHLPGFGFRVSRADVAHFMLGEVQANRHLRKVVGVCYWAERMDASALQAVPPFIFRFAHREWYSSGTRSLWKKETPGHRDLRGDQCWPARLRV